MKKKMIPVMMAVGMMMFSANAFAAESNGSVAEMIQNRPRTEQGQEGQMPGGFPMGEQNRFRQTSAGQPSADARREAPAKNGE